MTTVPETTSATTGADGTYEIAGVEAGTYAVTFVADGYVAATVADVTVTAGEAATADAALDVALGQVVVTVKNECVDAVLEGATVAVQDGAEILTNADGKATLDLAPGEYTLTVDAAGFIPAVATIDVAAGGPSEETLGIVCQRYAVAEAARNVLADVTAEQDPWSVFIGALDLFDNLNDGDDANDPLVVSVRAPDAYAIGHVPGAINIPWKTVAEPASIELLGTPGDGWLAAYCYTGHTGGIATAVLNLLGYRTQNLLHGMMSWTKDEAVRVAAPWTADEEHDFPVETVENVADGDYDPPVLDFDGVATEWDVIRAAASAYLNKDGMKPTITAQALFDNLNDGDDSDDPFILSVRSPADYAVGHVPGAVNIPWTKVALEENLRKLPTDRQIVVYCYTGHSGAIVTSMLGVLGYDTADLKFGIMSWTTDAAVRVKTPFSEDTTAHDFATEAGQ